MMNQRGSFESLVYPSRRILLQTPNKLTSLALDFPQSSLEPILVCGGKDRIIRVLRQHTGVEVKRFQGHLGDVTCLTFRVFPSLNMQIFSGSTDATIRIWDYVSGREVAICQGHTKKVSCICLATIPEDNKQKQSQKERILILSGSLDNTIRIWDSNGISQDVIYGHDGEVTSILHYNPGGKRSPVIVSGSLDDSIRIWDLATKQELLKFNHHSESESSRGGPGGVTALCLHNPRLASGDSDAGGTSVDTLLFSAGLDSDIHAWNYLTGQRIRTLRGHSGPVSSLLLFPSLSGDPFHPSLASSSVDGTVRCWDLSTCETTRLLRPHTSNGQVSRPVTHLGFCPINSFSDPVLVSVGDDCTLRQFSLGSDDRTVVYSLPAPTSQVFRGTGLLVPILCRFDLHSLLLARTDPQTLQQQHPDQPNQHDLPSLPLDRQFEPFVLSLVRFDQEEGLPRDRPPRCEAHLHSAIEGALRLKLILLDYDLNADQISDLHPVVSGWEGVTPQSNCSLFPHGIIASTHLPTQVLKLWPLPSLWGEGTDNLSTSTPHIEIPPVLLGGLRSIPTCVCFAEVRAGAGSDVELPQGDEVLVVAGTYDGSITAWTLPSSAPLFSFPAHSGFVSTLKLLPLPHSSPVARFVVALSSGEDGLIKAWDLRSQQLLRVFSGHSGPVRDLAFVRSGHDQHYFEEEIEPSSSTDLLSSTLMMVSAGHDKHLRLWTLSSSKPIKTVEAAHRGNILSLSVFQPSVRGEVDGVLLSGGEDGVCRVWSLPSLHPLRELRPESVSGFPVAIESVILSPVPPLSIHNLPHHPGVESRDNDRDNDCSSDLMAFTVSADRTVVGWDLSHSLSDSLPPRPVVRSEYQRDLEGGDRERSVWPRISSLVHRSTVSPSALFSENPQLFYLAILDRRPDFIERFLPLYPFAVTKNFQGLSRLKRGETDMTALLQQEPRSTSKKSLDLKKQSSSISPNSSGMSESSLSLLRVALTLNDLRSVRAILQGWLTILNGPEMQDPTSLFAHYYFLSRSLPKEDLLLLADRYPNELSSFHKRLRLLAAHPDTTSQCCELRLRAGQVHIRGFSSTYFSRGKWFEEFGNCTGSHPVVGLVLPIEHAADWDVLEGLWGVAQSTDDPSLFDCEVCRIAIEHAWRLYGRTMHITNLVLFVSFLLFFCSSSFTFDRLLGSSSFSLVVLAWVILGVSLLLGVVVLAMDCCRVVSNASKSALSQGFWFWSLFNVLGVLLAIGGQTLRVVYMGETLYSRAILSISSMFVWIKLFYHLRAFAPTGPTVFLVFQIVSDSRVYLLVLGAVVLSFAQAMWMISQPATPSPSPTYPQPPFSVIKGAVLSSFRYLVGLTLDTEFDSPSFLPLLAPLGTSLLSLYMVLVSVLLLNGLVAFMTGSVRRVESKGRARWRQNRLACILEEGFQFTCRPRSLLRLSFPCQIHVLQRHSDLRRDRSEDKGGGGGLASRREEYNSYYAPTPSSLSPFPLSESEDFSLSNQRTRPFPSPLPSSPPHSPSPSGLDRSLQALQGRVGGVEGRLTRTSRDLHRKMDMILSLLTERDALHPSSSHPSSAPPFPPSQLDPREKERLKRERRRVIKANALV